MSTINYSVGYSKSPRRFYIPIILLGTVFSTFEYLRAKSVTRRVAAKVKKRAYKAFVLTEGAKSIVKNFPQPLALSEHESAKKFLNDFRMLLNKLEESNYFNDKEIEDISFKTLKNLYSIESTLRNIAYADAPPIPEDKELVEFASQYSTSLPS